jgi:hypothetical protein
VVGNLAAAVADPAVWWAIIVGIAFGGVTLIVGTLAGTRLGLLHDRTSAGEHLGVGLGLGLLSVASVYALVVSRGSSSLTPIAAFLMLALVAAKGRPALPRPTRRGVVVALAAAGFLAVTALFMATTIAPSPRDGVQPIEFMDEAFYARLSVDLDRTGREWVYAPSGYAAIQGTPPQSWYHWGENWLGAVVTHIPGVSSVHARLIVVLPLILLAVFSLAGATCRRLAAMDTTEGFLLGGIGALLLAPLPLVAGYHFDSYASPLLISGFRYGLAAVPLLLMAYLAAAHRPWTGSWSESWTLGAIAAAVVALHVALAPPALVAATVTVVLVAIRSSGGIRALVGSPLARPLATALAAIVVTLAWGFLSGHGVPTETRSVAVTSFDVGWQRSVSFTFLFSGAIVVSLLGAWVLRRSDGPLWAMVPAVWVGVVVAAAYWGWSYPALNAFHVFFGTVLLVLTPTVTFAVVAMIAVARRHQRRLLAHAILVVLLVQVCLNAVVAAPRLNSNTGDLPPVPLGVLDAVRALPADARIAYSCGPADEVAPWTPRLGTITVHTGRVLMPMCFMADPTPPFLADRPVDPLVASPFVGPAQQSLFTTPTTVPTTDAILGFMRRHGIDFVYVDAQHPDRLALGGPIVHAEGDVTIYRVAGG